MDYSKIIEVVELYDYKEVNDYIKSGWIVLSPPIETNWAYSLGWDKCNGDTPVDPYAYKKTPEYQKEMAEKYGYY